MSITRTKWCLLSCVVQLFMTAAASAQADYDYLPYATDTQYFAPADLSEYGEGVLPNEGFFFNADYINWSISAPQTSTIGKGNGVTVWNGEGAFQTQRSTLDTAEFDAPGRGGGRYEGGAHYGNWGWLLGGYHVGAANQYIYQADASVVFDDQTTLMFNGNSILPGAFGPALVEVGYLDGFAHADPSQPFAPGATGVDGNQDFDAYWGRYFDGNGDGIINPNVEADTLIGPPFYDLNDLVRLPVVYDHMTVQNRTRLNGIELMGSYRVPSVRFGLWELYSGVRYVSFKDDFYVDAEGGILADSEWNTEADNNIVGPQIAARWSNRFGRIVLAAEGRFLAGFNFQSVKQEGKLATLLPGADPLDAVNPIFNTTRAGNLPLAMTTHGWNASFYDEEWAPVGELRFNASYILTDYISIRAGWTGQYMDSVARASSMVLYRMPDMGINPDENRQGMFVNGWNIGIEINR